MNKAGSASLGPYILRAQAGKLILPNEVAQKIENLVPMEEGTLRTITGPAALVDARVTTRDAKPSETLGGAAVASSIRYERPPSKSGETLAPSLSSTSFNIVYDESLHGIFHCRLQNDERDVLLLHTGAELWEFTGWDRNWRKLISAPTEGIGTRAKLKNTTQPQFPTQFVSTGTGVVIVPQDYRSYFYDGHQIAPLGFTRAPSSPQGLGPRSSLPKMNGVGQGVNDAGYTHDGTRYGYKKTTNVRLPYPGKDDTTDNLKFNAGMTAGFGQCHVGSITTLTFDAAAFKLDDDDVLNASDAIDSGWLNHGEYRCRVQFVDMFGNLSPLSAPSSALPLDFQPSVVPKTNNAGSKAEIVSAGRVLKQVAWTNIPTGPDHCKGRILYRSKDLLNSGSADYFSLPQDAMGVDVAFATLPDNVSTMYPDNISDGQLRAKAREVDPVPQFKLAELAFGRLWVGNFKNDPGMIRPSLPNRWGTFAADQEISPDPGGGEVTGLKQTNQGLLAFTRHSCFLVEASDDGKAFRSSPVSSEVGCFAPSSVLGLPTGATVWLGKDGFYAFDGTQISYISPQLRKLFRRATRSRLLQAVAAYDSRAREYRCWLSIDGSETNNLCCIYDGQGWRTRTDVEAEAVCTTQDHREYMIVAGRVAGDSGHDGPFVLDHSGNRADTELVDLIDAREAVIETNWIQGQSSKVRTTAHVVNLWLRETDNSELTIEVLRDWRNTTIEQTTASRYSKEDVPSFYGQTSLGSAGASFVDRRPYWTRAQIYVPSNETFKIRIRGTGLWEFVGLEFMVSPRDRGGAMTPP
jgi:hypothetical protein